MEEENDISEELDIADIISVERTRKTKTLEILEGEDGDSAYDIAVENGFIGSEKEWLKSLVGDKGEKGDKGDRGDDGDDYILTKEDKKEIASQIKVPVIEKIIEKIETIKEIPIVTNEIKEVAIAESAEIIVDKINSLPVDKEEYKIDAKHIKNLPKQNSIGARYATNGVKEGGVIGQKLVKKSNTDYDTHWVDDTGGGGGLQSSSYITNNQNIDVGIVYRVDTTNGDIILTLNDGNIEGKTLTVKKIDTSENSIFIETSTLIDGYDKIEISMQGESYDLYRTGDTFIIK